MKKSIRKISPKQRFVTGITLLFNDGTSEEVEQGLLVRIVDGESNTKTLNMLGKDIYTNEFDLIVDGFSQLSKQTANRFDAQIDDAQEDT